MLSFLVNLSITPLPAKELNETLCCVSYWIYLLLSCSWRIYELYAAVLTEFVYYSLTSLRIKWTLSSVSYWIWLLLPYQLKNLMNFMLRFIPNYVCHLLACTPEDLCDFWCPVSSLLSRRSVLSFIPNLWFVFSCKVGWSLLCNVF